MSVGPLGPVITAFIGVSTPREQALKAAGQPVPALVHGQFLVDTGASSTVVDPLILTSLNLVPTGVVGIHTPSTNGAAVSCNQYDVLVFLPSRGAAIPGCIINTHPIIESSLKSQGIDGLIGRDLLDQWTVFYNGPGKVLTISY